MKGKAYFRRNGLCMIPAGKDARTLIAALDEGQLAFMEVWNARNMAQHRKYFAVLDSVVEAIGKWTSTEHLRHDVFISLYRYDEVINQFTGEVTKVPHSMAVASMSKEEFERLYDDTIQLLTEALGTDPEMLEAA